MNIGETLKQAREGLGFNFQNKKEEPESKTIIKLYSSAVEYETNINDGTEHLSSDERMLLKYLEILDGDDRKNFLEEIKTKYIDAIVEKLQIK